MIYYFVRYMWFKPHSDEDAVEKVKSAKNRTEAQKLVTEAFREIQEHTGADSCAAGMITLPNAGLGIDCSKDLHGPERESVAETFGVYCGDQDVGQIDMIISNQENEEDVY